MTKLKKYFLLGILTYLSFSLPSCQTIDPSLFYKTHQLKEDVSQGQWEGSLLIKKDKKSFFLKIHFYALKNKALRIDVMTPFFSPILSLILIEEEFQSIFYQEKKYFLGKTKNLKHSRLITSLPIPINPILFHSLLFDELIEKNHWECKEGSKKRYFQDCKSLDSPLSLKWESFPYGRKKISITLNKEPKNLNLKNEKALKEKAPQNPKKVKENTFLSLKINLKKFTPIEKKDQLKDLFKIKKLKTYQQIIDF